MCKKKEFYNPSRFFACFEYNQFDLMLDIKFQKLDEGMHEEIKKYSKSFKKI